jgi:hypothetical protein
MNEAIRGVGAALLLACASAGCGGGWGMAVPADVAQQSEELPISDRSSWTGSLVDESFGVGSYRISDVDRKWNSTRTSSLLGFEQSRSTGGYAYTLSAADGKLAADCVTEQRDGALRLGDGAGFSSLVAKLGCSCRDDQGEATLILEGNTSSQYTGIIRVSSQQSYQVRAVTERENGKVESRDPLGYRVDGEAGPIGAVGVQKPGRMWIAKALPERARRELACVFAGLLIYQPPEQR